ncbi:MULTISPECIES: hypothetical protein [Micromonospora]|uniref:Uncharacterized protein n=1 Tax=Micromonospora sicca TaxID=2202420 RepID=A0A317CWP4_9ACTN|nr:MULTISPECIES: hypothetical protein [unclassified Micromonospora]MBM0228005.1 hypothetical protein [Micromonospora sp. ATA51]PWR06370.1 hypothetical protein DKT69_37000 [Micromonospora sp. 4G51]
MSPFLAVFLVLVLGSTSYAAGRLHGQLSYRIGYRFGYRQGYFDGDRGAWNRRRRDAQAAIASALAGPVVAPTSAAVPPVGTGPRDGTATAVALGGRPAPGPSSRATATAQFGGIATRQGTTYTGSSFTASVVGGRHPAGTLVRRQG